MVGRLKSKKEIEYDGYVYDIEVKDNHNYFANGVCVHNCKTPTSQQGKNMLKLKAKYKIGMTGTIITNSPLDLYVPLKFIEKDNSTFTNFKFYYCNFTGTFNNILVGYKNMQVLQQQLDECSLRRTKDILNLPPKTIINEVLDMNDQQSVFYNNIKQGIVEQADLVDLKPDSLLAMMTRLRQATSCPSMLTTENIPSTKIERAVSLAEEFVENGDKVVIFSCYKHTLDILKEELKKNNPLLCTGDIPEYEITENIKKFQENDKYKIMLATPQKMGTGITLTAAHYMIFIDCTYTQAQNLQCEDRIYRIGSKQPVFIYYLWCNDSVDMRVKEIVEDKDAIGQFIVDGKCSQQAYQKLKQFILDLKGGLDT